MDCGANVIIPGKAPKHRRERIRQEIEAAINGTWSGNILPAILAARFRDPLDIAEATERFRRLGSQEDRHE
jgi:hypothetical protein